MAFSSRGPSHPSAARWLSDAIAAAAVLAIAHAVVKMTGLAVSVTRSELRGIFVCGGATLLRVGLTLLLAGLWTIPAGVMIGLNARLSATIQPIVQVIASVPATALPN